ncbi:hypothetical protein RYA05_02265 [Pseudomonas syringae pv. actinidiae]|nr:hypothetical protein [Pseudomonas syringae pv. actinidiae]
MSIDVGLICAGLSLLNLIPFVGHLIIERLEMSKDEDERPGDD